VSNCVVWCQYNDVFDGRGNDDILLSVDLSFASDVVDNSLLYIHHHLHVSHCFLSEDFEAFGCLKEDPKRCCQYAKTV